MTRCATLLAFTVLALAPSVGADVVVIEADRDNTLYEDASGMISNGSGQHFFSGLTVTGKIRRALVHFDLAGAVPAGATITNATLTLVMTKTIVGPRVVRLHRATGDWGEGASDAFAQEGGGIQAEAGDATWLHTFFPGTFWNTPGGDFDAPGSASRSVGAIGVYDWSSVEMVADAQGWLDGPGGNFGWLIKHENETADTSAKRFASAQANEVTNRPMLTLEFEPPAECFLVLGSGPGSEAFLGDGHVFQTQIGGVGASFEVLLIDTPELPIPAGPPRPGSVLAGTGSLARVGPHGRYAWTLAAQVLMWNPAVFPGQPEQYSGGMQLRVTSGGELRVLAYGAPLGGITLMPEVRTDASGERVLAFPFTIAGL